MSGKGRYTLFTVLVDIGSGEETEYAFYGEAVVDNDDRAALANAMVYFLTLPMQAKEPLSVRCRSGLEEIPERFRRDAVQGTLHDIDRAMQPHKQRH